MAESYFSLSDGAQSQAVVPAQHQLLAPTLIRSQVLAQLYGLV